MCDEISVCAFPYVVAFMNNSMEIRLIVNGNLVHTMSMPRMQLVAGKSDIFFATTAPEFFPSKTDRLAVERQQELQRLSPPASPNSKLVAKLCGSGTYYEIEEIKCRRWDHFGLFPHRISLYCVQSQGTL